LDVAAAETLTRQMQDATQAADYRSEILTASGPDSGSVNMVDRSAIDRTFRR
jgi:hypothetical protein